MTTAYTSLLGLALPVTGELQGTWGTTVNNYITSYLDAAVAGTQNLSTDADATLTVTTNASLSSTSSQYSILLFSGARTAQRTVTVPAASKIYTVINATTGGYAVKVVASGPTTGITIANGESAVIAWNGSDFIKISNTGGAASFTNVTISGTTTLSGLTASTALALDASKNVVSVTNTGTGNNVLSASPTLTGTVAGASLQLSSLTSGRVTYAGASGLLQDSASLTFDGTTLTAGGFSTSGSVTLSGGTANGVLYLNGSKVATSGSTLVFDGTKLGVGTNSPTYRLDVVQSQNDDTVSAVGNANTGGAASAQFYAGNGTAKAQFFMLGTNYTTSGVFKANVGGVYSSNSAGLAIVAGGASAPIVFAAAGTSESMRLDGTGLGIGTSSPTSKLSIGGGLDFKSYIAHTDNFALYANSTDGTTLASYTGYPITFRIANSEKMRLDTSGNLGLGVTPSAWNTNVPVKGLQIGSATSLYDAGVTYGSGLAYNFYSSNSGDKYLNNGYASSYVQKTGQHIWFNAASGTAGNAISFTQAMTLDASGNLGVGETSPSTYGRFIVRGTGFVASAIAGDSTSETQLRFLTNTGARISQQANQPLIFDTNATERARITSGGDLLVGTTSLIAAEKLNLTSTAAATYTLMQQTSGITAVYGVNGTGAYSGSYTNQPYLFYTNNTERARIDSSGNLLVGTTSQLSNGKFAVYQGSNGCAIEAQIVGSGTAYAVYTARVNNTANLLHVFYYNTYSSSVGSISTDGTNTAYNTSSDYRLKNNPQPLTGSGAFIDALKPKTWTWKADGSKGVGFIAHEVQEVSPGSVVGEKDGEQMQAMEYGSAEFIANIIAELQQLRARVAQLEKGN